MHLCKWLSNVLHVLCLCSLFLLYKLYCMNTVLLSSYGVMRWVIVFILQSICRNKHKIQFNLLRCCFAVAKLINNFLFFWCSYLSVKKVYFVGTWWASELTLQHGPSFPPTRVLLQMKLEFRCILLQDWLIQNLSLHTMFSTYVVQWSTALINIPGTFAQLCHQHNVASSQLFT